MDNVKRKVVNYWLTIMVLIVSRDVYQAGFCGVFWREAGVKKPLYSKGCEEFVIQNTSLFGNLSYSLREICSVLLSLKRHDVYLTIS